MICTGYHKPKNLLIESSFLEDGIMILTPISSSIFFCVDPLRNRKQDIRKQKFYSSTRNLSVKFCTLFLVQNELGKHLPAYQRLKVRPKFKEK